MNAFLWILLILIIVAVVIAVLARFYDRATRETSLVRTGVGGRKVVMDGGTLAIPYFHQVSRVNMQTLRLEVRRAGEASLITKDRLRVDVGVEFYVTVIPNEDAVARAAQTLGDRTFHPEQLRELIEGKLVDALRAVAARFTMDDLHEQRGLFVAEVRDGLVESLARNGLELDSVSLTALDQTAFKALDENNAFNAVGMRKLAEVIAKSRKERAEIDADADVSVRRAAMEASKRKLQIDLEEQQAQIEQVQQIESLKAAQVAAVVRRKADSELESARARIEMEQQIRAADIARERAIRETEIARDTQLNEAEIAKERALREAEIAKDKALREAEIVRERDLAIAEQLRQIAVATKSQEESKARVLADTARAEAARAAEAIATARQLAEAERRKAVALLAAAQEAEIAGTHTRLAAAAERDAAADRAQAQIEEARADADATELRAAARRNEMLAQAEGQRAIIDAENEIDAHVVSMKIDLARLEALPRVVAEMVKPAERID
ncbi:MAG: hypothetical protein JSW68_08255 [Burkholderiales bacterium]|nr:MAG: hypothetical protein JSW68_08255 [Burkholderiales bacterium]